jgi:hypothetical protein
MSYFWAGTYGALTLKTLSMSTAAGYGRSSSVIIDRIGTKLQSLAQVAEIRNGYTQNGVHVSL